MPTKPPTRSTKATKPHSAAKKTIPASKRTRATTSAAKRPVKVKRAKSIAPRAATHPTARANTSKRSRLIDLLAASPGGTIDQMMKLTGWQAHTVRGTISGVLRKRLGLNVVCGPDATGARVYRIVGEAAVPA